MNVEALKSSLRSHAEFAAVRPIVARHARVDAQRYRARSYAKDETSGRVVQTRTDAEGVVARLGGYCGFGANLDAALDALTRLLWQPPVDRTVVRVVVPTPPPAPVVELNTAGTQTGRLKAGDQANTPKPAVSSAALAKAAEAKGGTVAIEKKRVARRR